MWEAVAGIIGLLAAGVAYWLKRAADSPVEKATQLENDLRAAKAGVAELKRENAALRLLNLRANQELVKCRRENYSTISPGDAADRLRKPRT